MQSVGNFKTMPRRDGRVRGGEGRCSGRWSRRRITGVVGAAFACVMATGCGPGPRPTADAIVHIERADRSVAWSPCVAPGLRTEAECATLTVPEAEGSQASLPLSVMRVRATAPTRRADPIVLLAGGPGQAGQRVFPPFMELLRGRIADRDLVVFDQRGTGASAGIGCDPDDAFDAQLKASLDVEELLSCMQRWPHDPTNFGTEAAARDIEAIRRALGYDRLNLVGGSYGTRLALDYARRFPDAVRTMVLDGVAPPQLALPGNFAVDAQRAFDAMLRDCAADPACAAAFPELDTALTRAMLEADRIDRPPLSFVHPRTEQRHEIPMNGTLVALLVRGVLYSADLTALLPHALQSAADGNFEPLMGLVVALGDTPEPMIDMGLNLSILCAEDLPRIPDQGPPSTNETFLGDALVQLYRDACARWPVKPAAAERTAPVTSNAPTLLLSGALDPVTPPARAEQAAATLSRATSLVFEGAGHGTMLSACALDIIETFVDTATMDGVDTSCVDASTRPPFFIDSKGPAH